MKETLSRTGPDAGPFGGRRITLAAIVSLTVLALDQATKVWAARNLSGRSPLTVVENFFDLTFHYNTGGVFGFLAGEVSAGRKFFFVTATLFALVLLVYFMREWGRESLLTLTGLSLVLGGALGNLVDRVLYGKVIDFIDWHWYDHHWPTFNIADSGITVGTALLFVAMIFFSPEEKASGDET